MKALKTICWIAVAAAAVAAFLAPLGPLPGFRIGGESAPVPASWGETREIHEIKLQIGEGPIGRTVIIWMVQVDGNLYVTGQPDSGWTQGIGAGSPVRLQLAGKLYELNATPVTDGKVAVLTAWMNKYAPDYPDIVNAYPSPEQGAKRASVFRLAARS